ncbi:hypothetical protein HanPSC8_Chr05g0225321 [Helianthus annuus]|nr:hypothetical protein HanIR_Chr05g0251051 [Helianthus annuus]KAJ0924183.1 hypothetical protein HanPSC8_Chr05g0225321 [Helianthus annuus]
MKCYTVAVEQGLEDSTASNQGSLFHFCCCIFFSSLVSCSIEDNEGIKCGEGRLASSVS